MDDAHDETLINGKVYEHKYVDITKSPAEESSAAPVFFWMFGVIVVVFVALYFLVPTVGNIIRTTEAEIKSVLYGKPVHVDPPIVRGSDPGVWEYFTSEGKSFILEREYSHAAETEANS